MDRCSLYAIALLASLVPTAAGAQCQLCAEPSVTAKAPALALNIEVETTLDFSRAAYNRMNGGGSIDIDPQTGARTVNGSLIGLGGIALRGTVRLTGQPFARVRVTLPNTADLISTDGDTARINGIKSNLAPDPALDAQGRLEFGFGGRMMVTGGVAGDFRGRIAITADYR